MGKLARITAALLLMPLAAPALAGSYPFTGHFTAAGEATAPDPLDPQRCALNFFTQNADGTFVAYHADLPHFHKTGAARYLVYQRGTCAYDERAKIETCNMAFDTDAESVGSIYENVLEDIGADFVRATGFDEIEQADDYVKTGDKNDGYANSYVRCHFDAAQLSAALTDRESDLDLDAREEYTSPSEAMLKSADVAALARRMGLIK